MSRVRFIRIILTLFVPMVVSLMMAEIMPILRGRIIDLRQDGGPPVKIVVETAGTAARSQMGSLQVTLGWGRTRKATRCT